MADATGPALPWGRQEIAQPLEVDKDLPATLAMKVGDRIEVKWEIEPEEGGPPQIKWWPATLQGHADDEPAVDGEGRAAYSLLYDADEALGYAEATAHRVTFLDSHELYDIGEEECLVWRREGDEWEEARTAGEGGRGVVTFGAVEAFTRKCERLRGKTVEQDCAEMLAPLPPDQQRVVAATFADAVQAFGTSIAELYAEKGAGHVVQVEDVEQIMESVKRQQRKRRADDDHL